MFDRGENRDEEADSVIGEIQEELENVFDSSDGALTNEFCEEYEPEPRSIIFNMLKQLRFGADLCRVTLPTFVLEPRSLLERVTDFVSYPGLILHLDRQETAMERFMCVVRYFLSSWHIRPSGVKKPYNPMLGEFFNCYWNILDRDETCAYCARGSRSYYFGEQVSHHPPISAYFYHNPDHGLVIQGNFRPKGRFLGNSVVSLMHGTSVVYTTARPEERYTLTNPNMYVRGLFLGKVLTELGDTVRIECKHTGLYADIEFKVKGYFFGDYNSISGKIRQMGGQDQAFRASTLFYLHGKWTDKIYLVPKHSPPELFLDVNILTAVTKTSMKTGHRFESRNLWTRVSRALLKRDWNLAELEKSTLEEQQRQRLEALERNCAVTISGNLDRLVELQNRFFDLPPMVFGDRGIPLVTRYFTSSNGTEWAWRFSETETVEKLCMNLQNRDQDWFEMFIDQLMFHENRF